MRDARAKLYMLEQQQQAEKADEIRGIVKDNGWGSQIRSYVLQPYTMVKDHRTGFSTGNVDAVLDGDLDDFMTAYLTWGEPRQAGYERRGQRRLMQKIPADTPGFFVRPSQLL